MKQEQLEKLKDGTLLVIDGVGFLGKEHKVIRFSKKDIWTGKKSESGYFYGSSLYPFEWLKLATEQDLQDEIKKTKEQAQARIKALKEAFKKAKQFRG